MRIEQLEHLIQIKQWGSMNIAAQYLHMTHQNLSRSIKQMEEELDMTILLRNTKGTIFTEDGEKLLGFAVGVINDYYKLLSSLKHVQESEYEMQSSIYRLNIALTSGMEQVLNPLLYNLNHEGFILYANSHEKSITECLELLSQNTHEIVILQQDYAYLMKHSYLAANYSLFALNIEKLELIAEKSTSYAVQRSISKKTLETIPLLVMSQNDQPSSVAQICLDNKIKLNIVSHSNLPSTTQELLLFGNICAIGVPSVQSALTLNPITRDRFTSIPIDIPLRIVTAFYIKKELLCSPLGDAILSILQQAYNKTFEQIF